MISDDNQIRKSLPSRISFPSARNKTKYGALIELRGSVERGDGREYALQSHKYNRKKSCEITGKARIRNNDVTEQTKGKWDSTRNARRLEQSFIIVFGM